MLKEFSDAAREARRILQKVKAAQYLFYNFDFPSLSEKHKIIWTEWKEIDIILADVLLSYIKNMELWRQKLVSLAQ